MGSLADTNYKSFHISEFLFGIGFVLISFTYVPPLVDQSLMGRYLLATLVILVVIPRYDHDYTKIERELGLRIIQTDGVFGRKKHLKKPTVRLKFKFLLIPWIKNSIRYILGSKDNGYWIPLLRTLNQLSNLEDLSKASFIAIALPFSVTLGTAFFLRKHGINKKQAIAEYGDPYYFSQHYHRMIVHKYLEKSALNYFEYVTITTSEIYNCFTPYKKSDKIVEIPHGIDFKILKTANYVLNKVPTFGYAGTFYDREREPPTEFLKFLTTVEEDFRFIVYTDIFMNISDGVKFLFPFEAKLKGKLIVNNLIARHQCIFELSKMDFLISIEARNAFPSKLIDYKVAKRPVLMIDRQGQYIQHFRSFMNGNYEFDYTRDLVLDKYDINKVGKKFLTLFG